MLVTGCSTVTLQLALALPTLTLMVAVPTPTAFTRPVSLTVTTAVSLLFQTTSSVKSSGVTVSISWPEAPLFRVRAV